MARTQTPAGSASPALPDPDDPGLRFFGPSGRPVVAGQEARAVLDLAGLTPRLNRARALSLLAYDEYDAYESFYEDLSLAPARAPLVACKGPGLKLGRGAGPPRQSPELQEAAVLLRAVIDEVVHEAVLPFRRAAVLLSGGMDSSVVAVSAAKAWAALERDPARLRFYHLLPEEGEGEARYARAVSLSLGHELVELGLSGGDCFEDSAPFFAALPLPSDGGGPKESLALARRMREDGCEVFLTGDGGDECFGGQRVPRRTRRLLLGCLPRPLRAQLRLWRSGERLPAWLSRRRAEIAPVRPAPTARRGLHGERGLRDARIRCARQGAIVAWHRSVGALTSLAAATPLLDQRVTDLVVSLPPHLLRSASIEKPLLVEAFGRDLPPKLVGRLKEEQPEVEGPGRLKFERFGPLWRDQWLRGGVLESAAFISSEEAAEVLNRAAEGSVRDLYRGWSLLGLELWVRAQGLSL